MTDKIRGMTHPTEVMVGKIRGMAYPTKKGDKLEQLKKKNRAGLV